LLFTSCPFSLSNPGAAYFSYCRCLYDYLSLGSLLPPIPFRCTLMSSEARSSLLLLCPFAYFMHLSGIVDPMPPLPILRRPFLSFFFLLAVLSTAHVSCTSSFSPCIASPFKFYTHHRCKYVLSTSPPSLPFLPFSEKYLF